MLGQVGFDVLEVDIGGWILRKHRRKYVRAEGIVHHIRLHRIGLGIAWNAEDPTTSRNDIVDIAITRPASALAPMIGHYGQLHPMNRILVFHRASLEDANNICTTRYFKP